MVLSASYDLISYPDQSHLQYAGDTRSQWSLQNESIVLSVRWRFTITVEFAERINRTISMVVMMLGGGGGGGVQSIHMINMVEVCSGGLSKLFRGDVGWL